MPQNNISNRFKILRNIVFILIGAIFIRLFFIQIIEHGTWVAKADEQHTILETITPKRGEIYMMNQNEPVAVVLNQTTYEIVIDPTVTKKEDIEKVINEYAKSYTIVDINDIYSQEGLRYSIVAKNIPRETAEKIADAEIPAIWLKKTNQRVYPEGTLASGVLGFVNNDGIGQYGVEGSLNEILSGKDGILKTTADVNKVALSIGNDNIKIPAEDGKNIVLSIDRGLEQGVEEIATGILNTTPADHASVLIMNPNNGEVLTMANLPTYDPNNYTQVTDASVYVNQVTDVPYEPASICKNFAFSAAINEGLMTGDTTYFNQGYEVVDNWEIKNAEQRSSLYGTLTMRDALYWSLNTGSIYALKLLGGDTNSINQTGREKLYHYYHDKFRLGQITGIELIEAEGYLPDPIEGWGRDSTYANMTFGQNLGITMIQTASAFSAVVNGGYWRTPSVVKGELVDGKVVPLELTSTGDAAGGTPTGVPTTVGETAAAGPVENSIEDRTHSEESTTEPVKNKIEDKILSDETSAMMREMLINNRSYRKSSGVDRPGYAIGGKSGTAQVVVNGAYDDTMSELVGSYIGFVGPEGELPNYVIMVKMWGEGQSIDSSQAMSLFESLSNYLIDYLKIKPKG